MTPEEHFARIDERLGAIAMHLEVTAGMQQDQEKRMEAYMAGTRSNIDRVLRIVEKTADSVASLADTAGKHEARIERLEG